MYRNKTIVKDNEDLIKRIISSDRILFKWCWEEIIKYISNKNIMLGGDYSIQMYSDKLSISDIVYNCQQIILFCENVYTEAKNLSNYLFNKSGEKIITVRPVWQDIEYDLLIKSRKIVKFIVLSPYKEVNIFNLINPVVKELQIDDKKYPIKLISPEILLIDLYRTLISPEFYDFRENNIMLEESLYNYYIDYRKINKIEGSLEITNKFQNYNKPEDFKYKSNYIIELKHEILNQIKLRDNKILITGRQAIEPEPNLELLEICSSLGYLEISEAAANALEKLNKNKNFILNNKLNISIDNSKHRIYVPVDMRLRRYKINVIIEDPNTKHRNKLQLIDIFNCSQYDLLINHPYEMLRFLFVNIWTLELVYKIGDISQDIYQKQIIRFIKWVDIAHSQITTDENKKIFDDYKQYIGIYDSDNMAKKRFLQKVKKSKTEIYYPCLSV